MKHRFLFFTTLAFFLVINTSYFWAPKLGSLDFIAFIILLVIYLILVVVFFFEYFLAYREKFANIERTVGIVYLLTILILTYTHPLGLIEFEKYEGNDLLVASAEGAANCRTTLKLKDNHRFIERSVCFRLDILRGTYELKGDSIFFHYDQRSIANSRAEHYSFAVIKRGEFPHKPIFPELVRYRDYTDTVGNVLSIIQ